MLLIFFNYNLTIKLEEIKNASMKVSKNANADIICLQEVDKYDEFYKKKLEDLGYEPHYFNR